MIYFIKSESGHVKIGYSENGVEQRINALQCGCPFELTLLKAIDGDREQEQLLHRKFKSFRCKGEWFSFTDEIMNFLEKPYKLEPPKKRLKSAKIIIPKSAKLIDPIQKNVQIKLKNLGIVSYRNLKELTNCSESLAKQLWYGSRRDGNPLPLSRKMVLTLKEKTGASLDYLLS